MKKTSYKFTLLLLSATFLSLPSIAQDKAKEAVKITNGESSIVLPEIEFEDKENLSEAVQEVDKHYIDIQTVTSPKGIKAWLVEDHSIPVIAMTFAFRDSGAKTDPQDKQGLARLASNTMDEGAANMDSLTFQKTLRDNSISLSFAADRDNFSGTLKTLSRNKELAFVLLENALTKPRFDDEPVARMRAANQSRIKSSISNPKWIAARLQNDIIFEGHPYALNSGGTLSGLDAITKEDLQNFHQKLGKNHLVVGVAGDITAQELASKLDEIFGKMPDTELPDDAPLTLENQGETYIYKMDIPQTIIEISHPGIRRSDEKFYSAMVMNFIFGESGFGSRLMEEIREKRGLTYGIYSYFREYDEAEALHITTSTSNDKVSEMLGLINEEIEKMKLTTVSEDELKDAKSYLIGSMPLSLTSTDSISAILTNLQLENLPVTYLDERAKNIRQVDEQDIYDTANQLLNSENFTTILVGQPSNEVERAEIIKNIPNVE